MQCMTDNSLNAMVNNGLSERLDNEAGSQRHRVRSTRYWRWLPLTHQMTQYLIDKTLASVIDGGFDAEDITGRSQRSRQCSFVHKRDRQDNGTEVNLHWMDQVYKKLAPAFTQHNDR